MAYSGCVYAKICIMQSSVMIFVWLFRFMRTLVFVTGNVNKVKEVRAILGDRFTVLILFYNQFLCYL